MADIERIYFKAKTSPNNLSFLEICKLAEGIGFEFKRQQGSSHRIYKHRSIKVMEDCMMNFQDCNGKAKPYQVRQLVDFIEKYNLL